MAGDVVHHETDVELLGSLPLLLERTHVSSYRSGRWFGSSWASTLDQRLEVLPDGLRFATADGMLLFYPTGAAGDTTDPADPADPADRADRADPAHSADSLAAPAAGDADLADQEVFPADGPRWPLTGDRSDGYVVADRQHGRTYVFDGSGEELPLSAILDRAGHRIDILRDASGAPTEIRHSGGYRIAVDTANDRITALRLLDPTPDTAPDDAAGPQVVLRRFRYDEAGNLAAVVNGSGQAMRFTYDRDGRMTGWVDRNGVEYEYDYDEQGRCVRTNGTGGFLAASFAYDQRANQTTYTNSLGATTRFVMNAHDQVVRRVDAQGGITRYAWDLNDHLTSETDPLGRTVHYKYDGYGNPTTVIRADGSRTVSEYRDGLPVSVTDPDGGVWRQEFDPMGNLTGLTDPSGATSRYGYDQRGHLESATDALGRTSTIACDQAGLPIRITDPLGAVTTYQRDGFGRIVTATDPAGGTTRVEWTVEGRIARITRPDGATERWRYDGEGNEVEYVDPLGQVTRTEYAPFDIPSARVEPGGARTTYAYDTELRLTGVTNPAGLTWEYSYDPVGNPLAETDFSGRRTEYRYDLAGRLESRTNGAGQVVRFVRDELGRVTERHADGRVARFGYDPMDRLVSASDGDTDLVMERDPLGRVLSERRNGQAVTNEYDPIGRRVRRMTPSGARSTWEYDAADRAIALHSAGVSVAFGYDEVGRQTYRQAGRARVAQRWDPNGRLSEQVLTSADVRSVGTPAVPSASRSPSEPVIARRGYRYRADDAITAVTDLLGGSRSFDLDPAGRVLTVSGRDAATGAEHREDYAYEPGGGLTHASWPLPPSATSSGPPASPTTPAPAVSPAASAAAAIPEPLDQRGPRTRSGARVRTAGKTHLEYDQQGRVVVRRSRTLSGQRRVWRYEWDSDDRLTSVVTPDGSTWTYRYDPLGRRIGKQRHTPEGELAERVEFHWDGVLLVEQVDASGHSVTWDYEPDSWTPVAQTERGRPDRSAASGDAGTPRKGDGGAEAPRRTTSDQPGWTPERAARAPQGWIDHEFYLIVTDIAGAPAELVDAEGELAWQQTTSLWGVPVGVGVRRTDCPLRFPGQYHDPETAQHYNYHRYYDPATGDYTSEDPFGLAGGPHPTRYVSNPLSWMDPLGLAACGKLAELRRLYGVMRAWVNNRFLNRSMRGRLPEPNATVRDLRDLTPGNPQRPHKLPNANARPDEDLLRSVFSPNDGQYIATHPVYPNVILQGNHRAYQLLQRAADPDNPNITWDTPIFINRGVR